MYCIVEAALLIKQIVRSGCIYAVEKIFGIKEKEKEKQKRKKIQRVFLTKERKCMLERNRHNFTPVFYLFLRLRYSNRIYYQKKTNREWQGGQVDWWQKEAEQHH